MKPYSKSLSSIITLSLFSSLSLASSPETVTHLVNEKSPLTKKACVKELLERVTSPSVNSTLRDLGFTTFKIRDLDVCADGQEGGLYTCYQFKATDQDKNEFNGTSVVRLTQSPNQSRYHLRTGKEYEAYAVSCSFPSCGLKYQIVNRRGQVVDSSSSICGGC